MNTNFHILNAKSFICLAAAACAIISGPVHANDHEVTVKISVSAAGLDLSQPAGAQKFYWRLKHAAQVACTHGDRVGLEPPTQLYGLLRKGTRRGRSFGPSGGGEHRLSRDTHASRCRAIRYRGSGTYGCGVTPLRIGRAPCARCPVPPRQVAKVRFPTAYLGEICCQYWR